MTDKYLDVHHHADVKHFSEFCRLNELSVVAFDNTAGAQPLDNFSFPRAAVLLFGNEGIGLTPEATAAAEHHVGIAQYGSVRSLNASAAGAIALFEWTRQHRRSDNEG
jgi:tRNA(Leu) C34 or U34 (ribose-2'-O)-methylase TrmL